MQDGQAPKQLLSERIKNTTNILVTVSRNPSVDELSAALALTLMLNKLDKHATAVFSGKTPPAIEFLNPEKTFEGTVDSLRDFIIALDKEKADRLRYKVEDDVVRIFITPYRTIISQKDLAFSQGDFNVELIIALGVEKREDLDAAITAHGRILHDATVATVNNSNKQSGLGTIDWTDAAAGSFCEMLMSLSESLQSGILDEQIATALLTGIVASTERFSNTKTTPKVMTMAAQLMAAGANQQLIAIKLEQNHEIPAADGSKSLKDGSSEKLKKGKKTTAENSVPKPDGEMNIEHEKPTEEEEAVEKANELADSAEEIAEDIAEEKEASEEEVPAEESAKEAELAEALDAPAATPTLSVEDLKKDIAAASAEVDKAAETPIESTQPKKKPSWRSRSKAESTDEPDFGGTLNATTEGAEEEKRLEEKSRRNRTLLSHQGPNTPQPPLNSVSPGAANYEPPTVDPFAQQPLRTEPASPLHYEALDTHTAVLQPLPASNESDSSVPKDEDATKDEPLPAEETPPAETENQETKPSEINITHESDSDLPTLSDLEAQAHVVASTATPVNDARAAVSAALDSIPFDPAHTPLNSTGAVPLPPLHEETPADAPAPISLPIDDESAPMAPPQMPDFSTLPPLPSDPLDPIQPTAPSDSAPAAIDPGQFKLPGQN